VRNKEFIPLNSLELLVGQSAAPAGRPEFPRRTPRHFDHFSSKAFGTFPLTDEVRTRSIYPKNGMCDCHGTKKRPSEHFVLKAAIFFQQQQRDDK